MNKYGLLPFIREDIFGLETDIAQIRGWELTKFNVPDCWQHTMGEDVRVAVIDTGCDINHRDIKNNILEGKNFVEPGKLPIDKNGHGTHVAGTIAAENNQIGMVGVAPKAKIIPVKSLGDNGSGSLRAIVDGIVWAADNGSDFITMSLGSPGPAQPMEDAIKYAASKGSIIFCAAGNSGPSSDIMYPAKYDHTISIGAIDENLNRTNFTCSGETLDFLAPGHNIFSCVPDNNYAIMSGTSMSNPFAVGCAALLLSYNRKHKKYKLNSYKDYIEVFRKFTIEIPNIMHRERKYQGYGILSAKNF